jgi:hypothetical protein
MVQGRVRRGSDDPDLILARLDHSGVRLQRDEVCSTLDQNRNIHGKMRHLSQACEPPFTLNMPVISYTYGRASGYDGI